MDLTKEAIQKAAALLAQKVVLFREAALGDSEHLEEMFTYLRPHFQALEGAVYGADWVCVQIKSDSNDDFRLIRRSDLRDISRIVSPKERWLRLWEKSRLTSIGSTRCVDVIIDKYDENSWCVGRL